MSFRNVIMERKGIEVKCGYNLRSRSLSQSDAIAQDSLVMLDDQSCWAGMPSEILRDVLMRIEASEDSWPGRKHVVACAGVCRSWREIMKDIVKSPQVSGQLTFPTSLKQPGPRDSLLQCYIKRNRSNQTYYLFFGLNEASTDDGKFLLSARKCRRATYTDFNISLNRNDVSRGSGTYIGKLRSNFLGTKFIVYDAHPPVNGAKFTKSRSTRLVSLKQVSPRPTGNYPIAHVSYDMNVMGARGPRIMQCVMDAIPVSVVEPGGAAATQTQFLHSRIGTSPSFPFKRSKSTHNNRPSVPLASQNEGTLVLRNKSPRWHEQLQCWCLNFNGRVTVASVKNFQLVASPENGVSEQAQENVILQFGKVGKDVFTMDYQYPISAFEAFAICLSSFDTKIACE